jgi:hypothetical protein
MSLNLFPFDAVNARAGPVHTVFFAAAQSSDLEFSLLYTGNRASSLLSPVNDASCVLYNSLCCRRVQLLWGLMRSLGYELGSRPRSCDDLYASDIKKKKARRGPRLTPERLISLRRRHHVAYDTSPAPPRLGVATLQTPASTPSLRLGFTSRYSPATSAELPAASRLGTVHPTIHVGDVPSTSPPPSTYLVVGRLSGDLARCNEDFNAVVDVLGVGTGAHRWDL